MQVEFYTRMSVHLNRPPRGMLKRREGLQMHGMWMGERIDPGWDEGGKRQGVRIPITVGRDGGTENVGTFRGLFCRPEGGFFPVGCRRDLPFLRDRPEMVEMDWGAGGVVPVFQGPPVDPV